VERDGLVTAALTTCANGMQLKLKRPPKNTITISGYNTMVTFRGDKLHHAPKFILDANLVRVFAGEYLCA